MSFDQDKDGSTWAEGDNGDEPFDYGIPRFEFVNRRGEKGWAEFADPDDLSRRDVKTLRREAGSSDNEGTATNAFFDMALKILVIKWEVPGRPDAKLPRHDEKGTDNIPAPFSAALEAHLKPHLQRLSRGETAESDNGQPGGFRRPGRG